MAEDAANPAATAAPAATVTEKTPAVPSQPKAAQTPETTKAPEAAKAADAPKAKVSKPKPTTAAGDGQEKLPWAPDAKAAAGTKPDTGKAKTAGAATDKGEGPLKMACPGLYEAACREVPACTWIADVKLQTGADVKAHCVDRKPKAAKDAGAKKPADKKASAALKPKAPAAANVGTPALPDAELAKEGAVKPAAPVPAPVAAPAGAAVISVVPATPAPATAAPVPPVQ